MPTAGEIEVAAEHLAIEELGAVRTRRALGTKWDKVDFLGADVRARLDDGTAALLQATKATSRLTDKRRKLERLGGDGLVVPQPRERRLVLAFNSLEHPEDARRRVHVFEVEELAWEDELDQLDREVSVDGLSRGIDPCKRSPGEI